MAWSHHCHRELCQARMLKLSSRKLCYLPRLYRGLLSPLQYLLPGVIMTHHHCPANKACPSRVLLLCQGRGWKCLSAMYYHPALCPGPHVKIKSHHEAMPRQLKIKKSRLQVQQKRLQASIACTSCMQLQDNQITVQIDACPNSRRLGNSG